MVDRSAPDAAELLALTADIVEAHVARSQVPPEALPGLIRSVRDALAHVGRPPPVVEALQPAVPVKRSIQHEYLVCLEDGAKVKTLKRYIGARFGLTPEAYRTKWGLPSDYPMVAPAYSAKRSAMAKHLGLGRRAEEAVEVVHPAKERPPYAAPRDEPPAYQPTGDDQPEVRHTAASVFANFNSGAPEAEEDDEGDAAGAHDIQDKPKRKRFAQQAARKMPAKRRA